MICPTQERTTSNSRASSKCLRPPSSRPSTGTSILNSFRSSKTSKTAPISTPNKKWISSSIPTKSQDNCPTSSKTPMSCKVCSRTPPTLPPGKAHQCQPAGKTSKEILKATIRGKVKCTTVLFPKLTNTAQFPANTTTGIK